MRVKTWLIVLLLPGISLAGAGSGLGDEILHCRSMGSPAERLDCYDQLQVTDKPASAQSAQTAAESAPEQPAPDALSGVAASESFGKPLERHDELEEMTAVVADMGTSATGKLVLTLDNGQVWSQTDTRRILLRSGDNVSIRKAALGSFLLVKVGSKSTIRVRRLD